MKTFLFIIFATLLSFIVKAQVVERDIDMSVGNHNGLEIDLSVEIKDAEKIWKDFVKPYGKVDWDKKNKEYILFNKQVFPISSSAITILLRLNQYGNKSKGLFLIKSGNQYLNSIDTPDEFKKAAKFLQEFAHETNRYVIREELKTQEKELESLDKDLNKLIKNNQSYHKEIEKAKQEIEKNEKDIEVNLQEQEVKRQHIEKQKDKIRSTTLKLTAIGSKSK